MVVLDIIPKRAVWGHLDYALARGF